MSASASAELLPGDALPRARTVLRLLPVLRRHPTAVGLTVLTAAGNQLFGIAAVTMAAWLTGQVAVLGGVPASAGERDRLVTALWWLGVLVLGKAALAWAESWVAHDLAYRVMVDLRLEVYDGLERLAPAWLLGRRSGDVAAAALSDVEALEWFYAHTAAQLAVTVLTPAGALAVMATIDPRLAAVLLPFVVAVATVPLWLLRRGDAQGVALRTSLAGLHADTADAVGGLREVIAFGAQRRRSDRLRAAGRRLARAQRAEAWRNGLENGATEATLALAVVAVLATGSVLVRDGQLGPAEYPVVTVLAGLALAPITLLTNGIRNLGVLRATASRVAAVADTRPRVEDPTDPEPPVPADPALRLEAVRFGYRPGTAVLDGVDLTVPHGATVALVGRSGAGKSTVAHLVLRFWDVDDGRVTLGGVDIRRLRQSTLRRLVALVPQDPYLFHGTIADNIRLGRPDATDVEVRAVAEQCLVTEFADRLPDGLDALVGERGATLSGGQRQRVALARALLPDPAVLVLDEPVSNLDSEGETHVQQALERARRGRTTLVIAHRLSTVIGADAVAVLDGGRVVESGAPADLAAGGAFRDLFADQWTTDD